MAEANGIKLQTLSWMLFGYGRSPWQRDVDRTPPGWFLDIVCAHTGLSPEAAHLATLESYRGLLYPKPRISGELRWVLPIVSAGASRHGFGVQFCPECLARDVVPYYRKQWRLAIFTYCLQHGCALCDACPVCSAPVAYFRHDFGKEFSETKGIACCWRCGFDFRQAEWTAATFPAEEVREIFDSMLYSLKATAIEARPFDLGFFAVVHQFCRIMGTRQNAGKLLCYVSEKLRMPTLPIALGRTSIEERRLKERHRLLACALWLMVDMENRLRAAWQAKAVRYNLMVKDFDDMPSWYMLLVAAFLRGTFHQKSVS